MLHSLKTSALALAAAALLAGCGGEKQPDIMNVIQDVGRWNITKDNEQKYANLDTNKRRQAFIRDKFREESAKAATDLDRQNIAAAIYLNFYMLQGQAIPDYCQGMNVDVSKFQTAFAQGNQKYHNYVTKILAMNGTTYEDVLAKFGPKLRTAAKYELMSTGSSYTACSTIKKDPGKYANAMKFAQFYPKISYNLVVRD